MRERMNFESSKFDRCASLVGLETVTDRADGGVIAGSLVPSRERGRS